VKNPSSSVPNNLPVPLSSFIGRAQETAELGLLLNATRVLTLTGAGGCGKTRLALRLASDSLGRFEDGAWWIELAALDDPTLLPQAVLQALGLPKLPGRAPIALLTDYFQSKHSLLILDNCEHVIDACARLVSHLLQTCPQLSMIITSREALNIDGEVVWIVPSLQVPAHQFLSGLSDLHQFDAVQLFIARAAAVASDFRLTEQNAPVVARICRRLDGIPLAIELAAARVRVLDIEQIAERLDDAMQLLTEGKRAAPQRHQTLRAAIDWSYELLSRREQALFRRLSVFVGGWTLKAAEVICAGDSIGADDILDLLAHLVHKSLVIKRDQEGEARYRFLEPIRQYARDKLLEADEVALLRDRHLLYFHDWAQATEPNLHTPEQLTQLANLDRELDNIRAALRWALETQPVMALQIVSALTMFWNIRGYTTEGRRWGSQALKQTVKDLAPGVLSARARALSAVAFLTMTQGDYQTASELVAQAITMLRAQNDNLGLARALFVQSIASSFLGQSALSRSSAEESFIIGSELDDAFTLSNALGIMAGAMFRLGETAIARHFMEEALANSWRLGSPVALSLSLWTTSMAALSQGNLKVARQYMEESFALIRQIGDKHRINMIASNLADILRQMDNLDEAEKLYVEAIHGWRDYGQPGGIARCLECLAFIAISERRDIQAARWLGAAEAIREGSHAEMIPTEQQEYQREMAILRGRINQNDFSGLWAEGRALTMQQVIAEVEQLPPTRKAKTHIPNALTPRELDVLRLLVQGLSDTQIAEKLVVSRRTVTTHLTTIYRKLGVNSRSAAMRHALDHKLI